MNMLEAKIKHYNLNLFYSRNNQTEKETNYLIQKKLNNFIKEYSKYIKTHIFILDYQNDIPSIICYNILQSLSGILNFNFLVYGKHFKTRKYLNKKQKFIFKYKLNKLFKKEKIIIISPSNPIYKVLSNDKLFNNSNSNIWYPILDFTISQLKEARLFYHIGYIKNDIIEDKRLENLTKLYKLKEEDISLLNNGEFNFISSNYNNKEIHLIKLSEDLEKNQEILNNMEKEDGMFFYSINTNTIKDYNRVIEQLKQFSFFIKNSSNTVGYYNIIGEQCNINDIADSLKVSIITHE